MIVYDYKLKKFIEVNIESYTPFIQIIGKKIKLKSKNK